ncbi:unnamed protein product [Phaeothamnion confervicola]
MLRKGLDGVLAGFGSACRAVGKGLDSVGAAMEGASAYLEKPVPSTRSMPFKGHVPFLSGAAFVAPTATVLGQVTIGAGSAVGFGAVLRGDVHHITVGESTTIGDAAVVHVAKLGGDFPTHIGSRVTVGPRAVVHACTLEDECVVGAAATVLDGCRVGKHAVLAPNTLVTPGTAVPAGQVWAGVPAAYVRDVTAEEKAAIAESAEAARLAAEVYAAECAKDWRFVLEEAEWYWLRNRE